MKAATTSTEGDTALGQGLHPEHLRLLREQLPVILFTLDSDLRFTYAEGASIVQWGLAPEAILGQRAETVFADDPAVLPWLGAALDARGETRWSSEFRGYTWDFRCIAQHSPQGKDTDTLVGVAVNVTERRHAEGELRWRSREMAALNAITSEVTSTLDFAEVLATLRQQLGDQLHILAGAVYLLDFATFEPELHTAWGVSTSLLERTTSLVSTQFAADLPGLTTLSGDLFRGTVGSEPWQSAFSVPLLSDDQMLGTLILFGSEPLTFSRHRPSFFEMLGRQVGAALQNARVFREVRQGREQLRKLTRRLVTAQEAERQRVARELHDELGQILTCLKLSLDLSYRPNITPEVAANYRDQAQQLTGDLIGRVRRMSLELRSAVLDELGLAPAIRSHIERFSAQTGITVHFRESGLEGLRFSGDVETAGYRIVQEALTNIARHAGASAATVALSWDPAGALSVRIEDDGVGFDTRRSRNLSSGLAGMRERAVAAGGTLVVESSPGAGTRVEAWLPVPAVEDEEEEMKAAATARE